MDMNYILTGKKKESKKQIGTRIKRDYKFNFLGKGNPNPTDKITKQQKPFLQSRSYRKRFRDNDKDGVINALDCKPNNPKKHGVYYRGINDYELKKLKQTGLIHKKQYSKEKTKRVYITPNKEFAKRYGDNLITLNIDDKNIRTEKGKTKVLFIEKDITPKNIKALDEDLSGDGFEVE